MAAAVSTTPNLKPAPSRGRPWRNPTRPPLLHSETTGDYAVPQRRPKEVASRYMSTSSSFSSTSSSTASNNSSYLSARRSSTPVPARTTVTASTVTPLQRSSLSKRSQSAERRRPVSAAAKVLISASKRSLSASFQGESLSTPVSKTKTVPPPNSAKVAVENARPAERNPWPARSRQVSSAKAMSTSVDFGSGMKKLISRSGSVVRALRQSLGDRIDLEKSEEDNSASANSRILSISASDTESVCSDSNSGSKEDGNVPQGRSGGARGLVVPARVWQETNNRIKAPVSPLCRSNSLKAATVSQSPRENLLSRGLSPLRGGGLRPASPSRMYGSASPSPSRAMASPSRVRNV